MATKKESVPSSAWGLGQLTEYAVEKLRFLGHMERKAALDAYRAGCALYFAQKKLLGKWNAWLDEHNIPRTTAWEAIKLYEECPNESDLAGLSLTEAKIKFGIYQEFSKPSGDGGSSGNGGGSGSSGGGGSSLANEPVDAEHSPEQLLSLFYHRLKGAAEVANSLPWTATLLYTEEVERAVGFCNDVLGTIKALQKRIKPPKAAKFLEALDEV